MNRLKILIIILFISLIVSNIFFACMYLTNLKKIEILEDKQEINSSVLTFTQLFVDKVLKGDKEVSFEDRLQLENSIRSLKDKETFDCWERFTNAKNQDEVQNNFYELFSLLLKKIER